ncbi:MAG: crossover junction endodeoxyribonuclease RuvC [Bacteroidales bacterium]|nr:crossover junction endodeoxyribonuclease RuvC [Bacteroidales bacterium]
MKNSSERIILGIDPGTTMMGYGVIKGAGKNPVFMDMGVVDLKREGDHYMKLRKIYQRTLELIKLYLPDEVAIEAPFYGKNVQSMLKLGRAQGVAMAAVLARDIPVFEYAPRKIKLSITSKGDASKEQVARMLMRMFDLKDMPVKLDATDGLAAAVCHFYQKGVVFPREGVKNWEEFIRKNPDRIK